METAQPSIDRDIRKLQQDITHGHAPVSTLLRRALVLAQAKGDTEFVAWIRKELDGYPGPAEEIPPYRVVPCELHCWNHFRGWLPVQFVRPNDGKRWSKRPSNQGVPVLETLLDDPRKGSTQLQMPLWPEAEEFLAKGSNYPNARHTQFVSTTSIESIIAAVRHRLLEWTLLDLGEHSPETANMDIQAKRFQFLAALHDAVGGDRHAIVSMWDIGKGLGFDKSTTKIVVQFLEGESLLEHRTIGGGIGITHHGVREVEDARSAPSTPTEYFPPSGSVPATPPSVTNILHNYGTIGGSVQQAGAGAAQTITQDQRQQIAQVLGELKNAMAGAKLDAATRGDIEAQVGTVEAQLKAANPPIGMIRGCLNTLRDILTSAAGQALGAALPGILKGLGAVLGI